MSVVLVWAGASLSASTAQLPSWLEVTPYPGFSGPAAVHSGPREETFRAVRSQTEWSTLWRTLSTNLPGPKSDAPYVDFRQFTMLVAALGTRPSGAYAVKIQDAVDDSTVIEVYVLEVRPTGPDCTATSDIAYPISIALIPRTDRRVEFELRAANLDCRSFRSIAGG